MSGIGGMRRPDRGGDAFAQARRGDNFKGKLRALVELIAPAQVDRDSAAALNKALGASPAFRSNLQRPMGLRGHADINRLCRFPALSPYRIWNFDKR